MTEAVASFGTLASALAERIRSEILDGTLRPGSKLKIASVSQRYAAGTSPVREALNRLAADGLVKQLDQRGFSVSPVSLEELRELVQTRCWVEAIALEQTIVRRTTDWEEGLLLAHHRLMRTPRSVDDTTFKTNPLWEDYHRSFHTLLISGCESRPLLRFCAELRDRADRYRQIAAAQAYPRRNEGDEHRAIMEAAINGDVAQAVKLLQDHYWSTFRIIETHCSDLFQDTAPVNKRGRSS
jgi:GntR family transcriptional regulator, carbon starvation induced regulator